MWLHAQIMHAGPDKVPKLPPVVYSHGMLGNRTCYSFPCIDLASYGFIVFAVEHADGSACLNCYPDKVSVWETSYVV